jgi:uncharacterized protein YdeI (BOF family)
MLKKSFFTLLTGTLILTCLPAMADKTANPLPGYGDGSPVVLTGTVDEVRQDEFDLNYGTGAITVELAEWKWSGNETRYLKPGDKVTVSGRIDDNLLKGRDNLADNLYLQNSYVYYYRNDANPSYYLGDADGAIKDGTYVSMRGIVTDVNGRQFTLMGANNATIQVDTSKMKYNPFDPKGIQHLAVGDSVHVYGELDDNFFESREIEADSIVVLSQVSLTQ